MSYIFVTFGKYMFTILKIQYITDQRRLLLHIIIFSIRFLSLVFKCMTFSSCPSYKTLLNLTIAENI